MTRTVGDLIAELGKLDPTLEVLVWSGSSAVSFDPVVWVRDSFLGRWGHVLPEGLYAAGDRPVVPRVFLTTRAGSHSADYNDRARRAS